ncbi:transposase (plasmid) [Streptosporangium sp. CA-135522]|uniref:transposase n=1 Tax=Streptosporangium sp. CA-135522 TaxID=3240072 RepID=UPI003D936E0A
MPLDLSNDQVCLLATLFPQLNGLAVKRMEDQGQGMRIVARTRAEEAERRGCGRASSRVHDRYRRRLQDLSCGGRPVMIELEVRRFVCRNTDCPVTTFAEQVNGLTERHQSSAPYPSDLSNARWAPVEPVLSAWRADRRGKGLDIGRPCEHDLRAIMNATLYLDRTGIGRRYLPHEYPPRQSVYALLRPLAERRRLHPAQRSATASGPHRTRP